jgi:16S rRNA (cytosine967-C5)-methyltransferase
MMPVRVAAAQVLVSIERGQTTLGAEMERGRREVADDRDRGLLFELAAGTLRWQNALDWMIAAAGRRAVVDLDPDVRATLRLGVYQLTHLDRVPPHAVVNESVEAVKSLGHARASGLVNAILRRIGRRVPPLPARPSTDADHDAVVRYLSVTLSHPAWLVERWLGRYGFEATERWCEFNNRTPEITIRSRGRLSPAELGTQIAAAGLVADPAAFAPDALRLPAGVLGRIPADLRSEVIVQDEGSQLVAHVVGARPGQRVLDLCAAPGGKTLMLHGDMRGTGLLVACDRRPSRLRLLRATVLAVAARIPVVCLDTARPLPFGPVFDRVLLDAPCSGLGTLRRDPDLKWRRAETDLSQLSEVQRRMISRAAEVVAPGGALVYATCSSEPEENRDVVDALLANDSRFARNPVILPAPASSLAGLDGALETLPFRDGLDGFFAAVLVRQQAT